jgi:Gas vesicle synthesis protein GvpL/GvpF
MTPKTKSAGKKAAATAPVFYLYAISQTSKAVAPVIASEGMAGTAPVEALRSGDYLCWISRVPKAEFADHLNERMQDLEWLATAGLRHQRVVSEISSHVTALPARFGTVFLSEESLAQHVKVRDKVFQQAFARVADADEWGIKIFAERKAPAKSTPKASSGTDYLKKKSDLLQPRRSAKLDDEVEDFITNISRLAVAASPGGKASAGQPGLVWHGSFLIRRDARKKLDAALKRYAAEWADSRRIDCSGPWPPYSFVEDHVQ